MVLAREGPQAGTSTTCGDHDVESGDLTIREGKRVGGDFARGRCDQDLSRTSLGGCRATRQERRTGSLTADAGGHAGRETRRAVAASLLLDCENYKQDEGRE